MKCPYCGAENQLRVVDTTHDSDDGIRRRRECKACSRRFSTYERVLRATPMLIKSNGDREAFDREKLIRGIQISCAKRPIPAADINDLVEEIETFLQHIGQDEVSSRVVGDMVIEGLKRLDPIAYIRYAIVYLGLDNLTSVRDMLDSLLGDQQGHANAKVSGAAPGAADSGKKSASITAGSQGEQSPDSSS
ncbi:MAG: transcriptional repressor NrdR [Chloroflexi bacterium]|nr:transcriptional repressor NrdR [Chloroflexota bacterium]